MNERTAQKMNDILDKQIALSNCVSALYHELCVNMADIPRNLNAVNLPSTISTMHAYGDSQSMARVDGSIISTDDQNIVKNGSFTRDYTFTGTKLSSISENVPLSDVTTINGFAFRSCRYLTDSILSRLSNATKVGLRSFQYCGNSFTSAYFPYVTYVDKNAFEGCTSLSSAYFPMLTTVRDHVFSNCGFIRLDSEMFPKLATIDNQTAFRSNTSLTSINLPSLTAVGRSAFIECTALLSVCLPNVVRTYTDESFYHCKSISSFEFPNLTAVGIKPGTRGETYTTTGSNFSNCYSLKYFSAPELLEMHGSSNFAVNNTEGDQKPSELLSVYLPKLKKLEQYCTSDGTVVSAAPNTFSGCRKLKFVYMPECPNLGNYAFNGCSSLVSVDLPNVSAIWYQCFGSCLSLSSVSLPKLTYLGDESFFGCASLVSVNLSGVSSVTNSPFRRCQNISAVYISNDTLHSIGNGYGDGEYQVIVDSTEKELVTAAAGISRIINENVSKIDDYAFCGFLNLSSAKFGAVSETGKGIFRDCPELISVEMSDDCPMRFLDEHNNVSNAGIVMLDMTDHSVKWGSQLKCENVTICADAGISVIGDYAFENCQNMASFELLAEQADVGDYAFSGCTGLQVLNLSGALSIGQYAFSGCTKFASIDLHNVKTVGNYAFNNCKNLRSVNLSSALELSNTMFSNIVSKYTTKLSVYIGESTKLDDNLVKNSYITCITQK